MKNDIDQLTNIGMTFGRREYRVETIQDGVVVRALGTFPGGGCDDVSVIVPQVVLDAAGVTARQIVDVSVEAAQFIDVDAERSDAPGEWTATRILKIGDLSYYRPSTDERIAVATALARRVHEDGAISLQGDQSKIVAIMAGADVGITVREARAAIKAMTD